MCWEQGMCRCLPTSVRNSISVQICSISHACGTALNGCIQSDQPLQVGAQDVAMGIKFSAACTLDIKEYPHGIPSGMCAVDGNWDKKFPCPSSSSISSSAPEDGQEIKDISFSLVEGDFQVTNSTMTSSQQCCTSTLICFWGIKSEHCRHC